MDVETVVKSIIIDVMNLDIAPDALANSTPLLGGELGINSLLGLQILIMLERHFGFEIEDDDLTRELFSDIDHLITFVRAKTQAA